MNRQIISRPESNPHHGHKTDDTPQEATNRMACHLIELLLAEQGLSLATMFPSLIDADQTLSTLLQALEILGHLKIPEGMLEEDNPEIVRALLNKHLHADPYWLAFTFIFRAAIAPTEQAGREALQLAVSLTGEAVAEMAL